MRSVATKSRQGRLTKGLPKLRIQGRSAFVAHSDYLRQSNHPAHVIAMEVVYRQS